MRYLLLYSLLLIGGYCDSQNLVPNPSFEDTVSCPDGGGQVWKAEHWYVAEQSPDYFNECCTNSAFAVPNSSVFGNRYPATGYAFCGFYAYSTIDTFYREKIGVQLTNALFPDTRYFVSFKLTTTAWHHFNGASNKIGALFSTGSFTPSNPSQTNDYCQIWIDSIISDTTNWVHVWGSFVADSAYTYMTIGNFFTNSHTDTIRFWEPPPQGGYALQTYCFIDDICVSRDSSECDIISTSTESLLERQIDFTSYPNPVSKLLNIKIEINGYSYLELCSVEGNRFQLEPVPRSPYNLTMDVSHLNNGVYVLNLISDNKTIHKKVIINH